MEKSKGPRDHPHHRRRRCRGAAESEKEGWRRRKSDADEDEVVVAAMKSSGGYLAKWGCEVAVDKVAAAAEETEAASWKFWGMRTGESNSC